MKKKVTIIVLSLMTFLIFPLSSSAKTLGDLYDELDALKEEKRTQDEEKKLTKEEYNRTSNEIYKIETDIQNLNKRIEEATAEISKLEKEIVEKQEEIDRTLTFLQISSGEKSYLEYIFKAKSFTDFIHRASVVEQLSKNNKELIKEMNNLIKRNNELKEKLKKDIAEEEIQRKNLQSKLASLGTQITELDEIVFGINEKIEAKESEIKMYESSGCKSRSDNLATCMGIPRDTGFIRPIVRGTITSNYGYRTHPVTGAVQSFHSGLDMSLSNAEGTNIYPIANGKVAARVYRSSCGGNMVFIYHDVNGEKWTSVYMHLLSFNEKFQVGDVVSSSDVIGYMGGWSTSTSHGGYDGCTTGAHLHLTMAKGNVTSSYRSYLIDPKNKIYFPDKGYWWSSRTW